MRSPPRWRAWSDVLERRGPDVTRVAPAFHALLAPLGQSRIYRGIFLCALARMLFLAFLFLRASHAKPTAVGTKSHVPGSGMGRIS